MKLQKLLQLGQQCLSWHWHGGANGDILLLSELLLKAEGNIQLQAGGKKSKTVKSSFLKKSPGPERRSTDHVLDASRPSAVIHACVFIRGDTVSQQWGTAVLLLLLLGDLIYQSYDLERVILSSRSQLRDTLTCPSNWSVSLKRGNLDFWCVSSRKYAICQRDHCKKKEKKKALSIWHFPLNVEFCEELRAECETLQ